MPNAAGLSICIAFIFSIGCNSSWQHNDSAGGGAPGTPGSTYGSSAEQGLPQPPGCDPDGYGPCVTDFYLCHVDLAGNKRCESQAALVPDDQGGWVCSFGDEGPLCVGDHMPTDAGGWQCEEDDEGSVTCQALGFQPSQDNEDQWNCDYEGEFLVCETEGDGSSTTSTESQTPGGSPTTGPVPPSGSTNEFCFHDRAGGDGPPVVRGWYDFESVGGQQAVHVVLVFDEGFVDNRYGANTSDGYRGGKSGGHTFTDLVRSDHAEVGFLNGDGDEVLRAKFDYITDDQTAASGYDSLGVTGGDGSLSVGSADAVLDATSSLARNFNERNCVFTEDSPDAEQCPEWENRVIYEMWIDLAAFGPSGYGRPNMEYVHASPSRTTDTIYVNFGECI